MSILKTFIPNFVCVFSQIKDRKYIEQNVQSAARVMPWGWDLGCWGGGVNKKNFSVGFAMAPHRLRLLVGLTVASRLQQKFSSDWVDAQTAQSLRWTNRIFVGLSCSI